MRVINIVDNAELINYGVWNAAISNAEELNKRGIEVELWHPGDEPIKDIYAGVVQVSVSAAKGSTPEGLIEERGLDARKDIIMTHGCWRYPTRWGYAFAKRGFQWIYVPHGMLEPWSMQQKRWKKNLFFYFFEKRMAVRAAIVRAVSQTERDNLHKYFRPEKVRFMPNGIKVIGVDKHFPRDEPRRYLFLSRLHAKKNLVALGKAWVASSLNNRAAYELVFAGPDQGELPDLQEYINQSSNIIYTGSVYGREKEELIRSSTFYVLPSFSEGLPSSLLEAMSAGLVPMITEGCNLPEVFTMDMGVKLETDWQHIKQALEEVATWKKEEIVSKSTRSRTFAETHFALAAVTREQHSVFQRLLTETPVN
jgi:glycosyltransferase involved in cell wall biosynthesis